MKIRTAIVWAMLLGSVGWLMATPALAQGRSASLTVRFAPFSPIIALIAGILILIFPRLLNYIVAIYLILIGLLGLLGR